MIFPFKSSRQILHKAFVFSELLNSQSEIIDVTDLIQNINKPRTWRRRTTHSQIITFLPENSCHESLSSLWWLSLRYSTYLSSVVNQLINSKIFSSLNNMSQIKRTAHQKHEYSCQHIHMTSTLTMESSIHYYLFSSFSNCNKPTPFVTLLATVCFYVRTRQRDITVTIKFAF